MSHETDVTELIGEARALVAMKASPTILVARDNADRELLAKAPTMLTELADEVEVLREQVGVLWNKAQRVLNKSNSANDTWVPIPKSTLDELGAALDFCRPKEGP